MLFSVIIPIYNVEKYLEDCLGSIQNQTFKDFEVIMVNDGSTDGSTKICEKFVDSDNRFHHIYKTNGGQSTARNTGIAYAKGEYLIFIDSDDFFTEKTCFQTIADNLFNKPDILAYQYYKYFSSTRYIKCGNMPRFENINDKLAILEYQIKYDSFFCSCWSKTVKRQLIVDNNVKFDESLACEDMDWYFTVVKKCKTIKCLDVAVINYRQRSDSVTSGNFKLKNLKDYIYTIEKWTSKLSSEKTEENKLLLNALAKLYCNLLIAYSRNKDKSQVIKELVFKHKSLLNYDLNPRTSKFHKVVTFIGLNAFTQILYFISKFRK